MTLIELMVSITLGLILSGAVSALYLATSQTNRQNEASTRINDNARQALDLLGRDLQMAGYYPVTIANSLDLGLTTLGSFHNAVPSTPPAYNAGLFGCEGGFFDPTSTACNGTGTSSPDGLVVSYFTEDNYGAGSRLGTQRDCLGQDVDTSSTPYNQTRRVDNLPVQIINHYRLISHTVALEGRTIATQSLACQGNGDPSGSYVAIANGIEDFQVLYGVAGNAGSQSPNRFFTADNMAANQWNQVSAVRVCLLARSLDHSRLSDKGGSDARTYVDCQGNTQTLSNSDRRLVKRYEQTFALRNHLTGYPE